MRHKRRMIRVLVVVVLAALTCIFAAGCEDLFEDLEDEDDYDFNGDGNGSGNGGDGGDLNAQAKVACPIPNDNTPYEGIRYWRGDACSRTITGECTGTLLDPVYHCGQSCLYRFIYDRGTSDESAVAIGRLRQTCAILRQYGEATIQACVPCDGL